MRAEHQCIIDYLQSGKKFVTASHRQSRFIQSLWQAHQLQQINNKQDSVSWQQADCISWDDWLLQNFEICTLRLNLENKPTPKILSTLEQRWIWQKNLNAIDKQSNALANKPLTQQQTLLNSLLQAWTLLQDWQLQQSPKVMNAFNQTEETRLFRKLVTSFEQTCDANLWISKQQLPDYIAAHFDLWKDLADADVCYFGFDDWTPQQQQFLAATTKLQSVDFNQIKKSFENSGAEERLHPCASKYSEWQQAAVWARKQAEQNPSATIAVVIPSLANDRAQVLRVFQEIFQPQLQLQAESKVAAGFNLSVGASINQQMIIQSARNWFSLLKAGSGEAWKKAITDIFCSGAIAERWSRAALSRDIQLSKNTNYSVLILQKIIAQKDSIALTKLSHIFEVLEMAEKNSRSKKTSGEWCLFLEQLLTDIGWPGNSTLTSQTYQAKNQWLEKFRQLSAMDEFCGKQSLADFLNLLDEQMNSSKFQPQTPPARVQVLGLLEAIGLSFNSIWLSGCQDSVFPAPLNASPWLPINIQQSLLMPGASAPREQQFAQNLFSGLQNNCEKIHYSYALTEADSELKPCAFVEHLSEQSNNQFVAKIAAEKLPNYWHQQLTQGQSFVENWIDTQGLPLASEKVKSGVGILKHQASCPFKAYAEYRLTAGTNREQTIGIDPMQRGNWIHDVLEMVWLRLATQSALLAMSPQQQLAMVIECTKEIILQPTKRTSSFDSRLNMDLKNPLVKLEFDRTVKLVMAWLEVDRNRPEFVNVEVEQSQQISISGLSFLVRADRIDEIENGQKLIIDYKTGITNLSSWFKERITEPQLPLYGLIFTADLAAVAIAELIPTATKLKGYGEQELEISGVKPIEDWANIQQQWKSKLEAVALEFKLGHANIDANKNACRYCEYAHLCRRDGYFILADSASTMEDAG